ncbi:MAG TPA: 2-succinyl-5-enolpyruvyl-6-hydroxy-3-cyclohexene-1-carboxylic-acid synthase [Balneolaceae bacterium]|nr:2-succinyl-5-enolpyruvyl-6-hydroxy-3-cyclohexene-1-carboxylic-acid synthase [Balneolaceae bacterium]
MESGNIAFRWTTVFFRELSALGVGHAVISPGSRSTPLTLAVAANKKFEKHVILDERSAAFTALGIGKATGAPAVLICTSGTAVANYFPAVIEARKSGVPLILATADRPPNLRATGANQAIDQLKIFGDYPVFFHEVGEPNESDTDLNRLKMLADQSVTASREQSGPVHLNFPFRKPLEPSADFLQKVMDENDAIQNSNHRWEHQESLHLSDELQKIISSAQKPLIIIGPAAPKNDLATVSELAEKFHCPVLSESAIDSANSIRGFTGFLRNDSLQAELEPDLILRFGFQSTSKALEFGLKNWKPKHHFHFVSTPDWHDTTFTHANRIPWLGRPVAWGEIKPVAEKTWLEKWKKTEQDFQAYYEKLIADEATLTDGSVYHHLTPQIPVSHFLAVSNSFPARDIQLFGRQKSQIPLFLNRGASGIDGLTSTAIGLSLGLQKPGLLFTGDLAFLHDTNALLNRELLEQPLVVIVINNSGGSIFRMLPVEQHEQFFKPYFETPQSVDVEKLVDSYQIPYQKIDNLQALNNFDLQNWMNRSPGLSVVECKTDADASMKLRKSFGVFSDEIY